MDTSKKTIVKLLTFQTWNSAYFGCKSELKKGVAYVSQVWCKACVSNQEKLYQRYAIKGVTKKTTECSFDGTGFITEQLVQIRDRQFFYKN